MKTKKQYNLVIVGGGAAGFFCAIQCAERNPDMRILILEKSDKLLSKVKISGGGRCNVTHACFDPKEMVEHYPRGKKELLGPFYKFLCGDMIAWLEDHGVETKIEEDGRVFPTSDNSQDIIDCFLDACKKYEIEIQTQNGLIQLSPKGSKWKLESKLGKIKAEHILFATGSSPSAWRLIHDLGHEIVPPVPSLFTFNINSTIISELAGISVPTAIVKIKELGVEDTGPLLITHWGLSGPAILKLSAWAARELNELDYKFNIEVNWTGEHLQSIRETIQEIRHLHGKQLLSAFPLLNLPRRLWAKMIFNVGLHKKNYASLSSGDMINLTKIIGRCTFKVNGKSTYKSEFVTCGGIETDEIDFRTMQSKLHHNLYFAGEVINIDAITGGFNFQAAWTEAFIAAKAITSKL